ncbi:hypothetical protein C0992_012919 [Termitomyces sp. T32_za158]|nr:hypothetical protein C0992_012919 [Termitomyces sp. T32_za158]
MLKQTYWVILALQSVSDWNWDDKKGCNITPELESSWAAYVKVHKQAAPFKKEGWCYLELMSQIMPSAA